jgi:hypothetical protein
VVVGVDLLERLLAALVVQVAVLEVMAQVLLVGLHPQVVKVLLAAQVLTLKALAVRELEAAAVEQVLLEQMV